MLLVYNRFQIRMLLECNRKKAHVLLVHTCLNVCQESPSNGHYISRYICRVRWALLSVRMCDCVKVTNDGAKVDEDATLGLLRTSDSTWEGFSGEEARSGILVGDGCQPCPCNPTFDLQTSLIFSSVAQAPQPDQVPLPRGQPHRRCAGATKSRRRAGQRRSGAAARVRGVFERRRGRVERVLSRRSLSRFWGCSLSSAVDQNGMTRLASVLELKSSAAHWTRLLPSARRRLVPVLAHFSLFPPSSPISSSKPSTLPPPPGQTRG
ncbi:hypothetical protein IWZ03DRAFT_97175 [Phyllosticta citriasiana]|uniref:Uncharacterized protein n=1 Tax=Phyllosticta citriasiana TaxID=595635 RepID=A0ABR1KV99_9PEZI